MYLFIILVAILRLIRVLVEIMLPSRDTSEENNNTMDYLTNLDNEHPLLEPLTPCYSHATVRRAFIVWLRCGRRNHFKDVCNYYHYLEALEDSLPADTRASSRHHEFSLFVSQPPTSPYLQEHFPDLYSSPYPVEQTPQPLLENYQPVVEQNTERVTNEELIDDSTESSTKLSPQDIFKASQVFRSDCHCLDEQAMKVYNETAKACAKDWKPEDNIKIKQDKNTTNSVESKKPTGTSKQDILETSQMIKNYCRDLQVPLKNFLESFKEYAARCELSNTVNNVGFYIKRKMIQVELPLAVKVHRAKVNIENKENLKRARVSPKASVDAQKKLRNVVPKATQDTKAKESIAVNDTKVIKGANEKKGQKATVVDAIEKTIKLLKREESLKSGGTGFSSSHFVKPDTQKCRKI